MRTTRIYELLNWVLREQSFWDSELYSLYFMHSYLMIVYSVRELNILTYYSRMLAFGLCYLFTIRL